MDLMIKDVIVPLLTLFNDKDNINPSAAEQLVDFLISRDVCGLFSGGTTDKGLLLIYEKCCYFAELVARAAKERVLVIIHTGAVTTRIQRTER